MGVKLNSMGIFRSRHTRCSTSNTLSPGENVTVEAARMVPSAGISARLDSSHLSILSRMVAQEMEMVQVAC